MQTESQKLQDSLQLELQEAVLRFLSSPSNDMGLPAKESFWDEPIFGVASGADPLWAVFKEKAVGSNNWTPREAFLLGFPQEAEVRAEELSVLVWILPQTMATKKENGRETVYPSERWLRSRWFGESEVNVPLRRLLVSELSARGIQAVSPLIMPEYLPGIGTPANPVPVTEWSPFGRSSNFSERHAAYAAGLGTFGLCDGLITRVGKAHRIGSVVLRAQLEPTPRPYTSHNEYCLYYKNGSCGVCVKRCPVGSVQFNGRDKEACLSHLQGTTMPYAEKTWGWKNFYACGLCQVNVPCESRIPV